MWIACLALALQTAPAAPSFDASVAVRLLQHSTLFTARSGRTRPQVGRIAPIDSSPEPLGYFVEASWTVERDGSPTPESGVATVVHVERLDADARVHGVEGVWTLWELAAEKTWDEFQSELVEARARAQEANVLGQLRSIQIGQVVFAGQADGAYAGEWRCLTEPAGCLDGYEGGPFLQMPATETDGYRFTLHGRREAGLKPGLVAAFVATAVPLGATSEKRSFCADAERLCALVAGTEVAGDAGACPEECAELE
jgi:hypothetical protein